MLGSRVFRVIILSWLQSPVQGLFLLSRLFAFLFQAILQLLQALHRDNLRGLHRY